MAVTGGKFPYDAADALVGPARVLVRDLPSTPGVPSTGNDILPASADANGVYAPASPWIDLGLSADKPSYTVTHDDAGIEYEQAGTLFNKIQSVTRQMTLQMAAINPVTLAMIEQGSAVTVAAATDKPAYKTVGMANYSDTRKYQVAIVAYRPAGTGDVVEKSPSTITRPAAVFVVGYNCALASSDRQVEFSRGDPVNVSVSIDLFPYAYTGQPADEDFGKWWLETPGTIS